MGVPEAILGAVLIGGASRRMGRDKALLPVEGQPLAERVARTLERVVSRVVLVGRDREDDRFPDRTILADRFPGQGPLAGLHAALLDAAGEPVFLAACDLPGLTPRLIRWVIGDGPVARDAPQARVPVAEGRLQPLCALYGPACLGPAEEALEAGRLSMHRFLEDLDVITKPLTPDLPFYDPDLLVNWNEPDDVERRFS